MKLEFIEINKNNMEVFTNLAYAYEAEFSNLTLKFPNKQGLFEIDTYPYSPYVGYLAYYEEIPIGFCVANVESEIKDVAEFYIVPIMRSKKLGYQLAEMIFNTYPGQWQVRQIKNAVDATNFWRSVIKKYTHNDYEEVIVEDIDWGIVTRQRFEAGIKK